MGRRRIAFLSPSLEGAQFDSRTWRMARSAAAAGYDVVIYGQWFEGLPFEDSLAGYRVVRVPVEILMAVPGLRWLGRMRIRYLRVRQREHGSARSTGLADAGATRALTRSRPLGTSVLNQILRWGRRLLRQALWLLPRWIRTPMMWISWRAALLDVVEPADIWHGMWIGSLPAIVKLGQSLGGAAVYDSRDIFFESRDWPTTARLPRAWLMHLERRWARDCAAVVTVSEAFAEILAANLGIPRPLVVMNCPERFQPPTPRPNLIRERLDLPDSAAVVLYQGALFTERGIEQTMDAVVRVEGACFVLIGYGNQRDHFLALSTRTPYAGRVFLLDPVPPAELLAWTASADASIALLLPTSLNHQYATPQKLFEAIAAGVPVVGSDLPGIAAIIRDTQCGVLCDATSPDSIARAIRSVLHRPEGDREAQRARCRTAARDRYNWESQVGVLLELYTRLAPVGPSDQTEAVAALQAPSPSESRT